MGVGRGGGDEVNNNIDGEKRSKRAGRTNPDVQNTYWNFC